MVEFYVIVNEKQGTAYIPKEIRKGFGHRWKILPNCDAGIIYPENVPVKDILNSVNGLRSELKRRIEKEEQKSG